MNKEILFWNDPKNINFLACTLKDGKIIVGTSDTVLGLLAAASPEGALKLNSIKERVEKPYIILIDSQDRIYEFTDSLCTPCKKLLASCWPGPLTVIVRAAPKVPTAMKAADGTIALRVPQHKGLQALLQKIPALFSTSANKSGQPIPLTIEDIAPDILNNAAALVIDQDTKTPTQTKSSTIVDCTDMQPKIIRHGAYSQEYLASLIDIL